MKIGILQTGTSPGELKPAHGDYDGLFSKLLDGRGFTFETCRVLDGELPPSVTAADGWLITGSKFGAYEDHAWIPPLEDFLREAYAQNVPIVGVCFGHQILAQALGGKVEKFNGGWSVGPTEYTTEDGTHETLMAWHQDQVTVPPDDAQVIGTSATCRYAMLTYGNRALTVQPHPEFTAGFLADLIEARRGVIPADIADAAASRLNTPLTSTRYADRIEAFFKAKR